MKVRTQYYLFIVALLSLCGLSCYAQTVNATAGIDSTVIVFGNQTHLHLKVTYDTKGGVPKIQWPFISDSLVSKVHVVSKSKIDTVIPDRNNPTQQAQTQDLVITGFDSGYYAIPPFQFIVNGDTAHPVLTDALMMQVRTFPVDTNKGFRDIKGPIQVKFPFIIILMYAGIALAVLALIGFLIYYFIKQRKNKVKEPVIVKAPPIAPHIKALKALEELASQQLWQNEKVKEYYSGIADILRVYLDDRFRLGALEMTTDEIMLSLRRRYELSNELKTELNNILVLSDLVKFAKEKPIASEHELTLSKAIDFLNNSAHNQEQQPPAPTPVQPEVVTPPQTDSPSI